MNEKIVKEMFNAFWSSANETWGTISMLQNQTERAANVILNKTESLQEQNRRQIKEFFDNTKESQKKLRQIYSDGLNKIAELIE